MWPLNGRVSHISVMHSKQQVCVWVFLFAFVRHTHKTFFVKLLPSGKSVFAHKEWFSNI